MNILTEVRRACRLLAGRRGRGPALGVVAVLALCSAGLGLAAGLANALWIAPLPFPRAGELKVCELGSGPGLFGSTANLKLATEWQNASPPGVLVGGFQSSPGVISGQVVTSSAPVVEVTKDLLALLGVQPAVGRLFGPGDYRGSLVVPAILSGGLAQELFGGSGQSLGRRITISGKTSYVVGVMPNDFHVPLSLNNGESRPEVWVPLMADNSGKNGAAETPVEVLLRIRAGIPTAFVASLFDKSEHGATQSSVNHAVISDVRDIQSRDLRSPLNVMICAAAVMMLMGFAGVFVFLAVRGREAAAQTEIKLSLGAPPLWASAGQAVEGTILGLSAGVVGAGCAWYLFAVATKMLAPLVAPGTDFAPLPAVIVAFVAALLAGIVAGACATAARTSSRRQLRPAFEFASHSRERWTRWPIAAEIAVAVCVGACLLIFARTYNRLTFAQGSYASSSVLASTVSFPQGQLADPAAQVRFASGLYQNLSSRPEFQAVSVAGGAPVLGGGSTEVRLPGHSASTPVYFWSYLGGYFRAMGLHILRGSLPQNGGREIVIDEAAAAKLFGSDPPVGKTIVWGSRPGDFGTVAAIVSNLPEVYGVQMGQIRLVSPPHVYVSFAVAPTRSLRVVAAIHGQPEAAARLIAKSVASENGLAVVETKTMAEWAGARLARERLLTWLLAIYSGIAFGACALSVFAIGVYCVSTRQREFAIRLALGAERGSIARLVLRSSLIGTTIGTVIGAALAWDTSRVIAGLLLGTDTARIVSVAGAATIVGVVSLAAALPSVLSATRQPILSLLHDA